MARRIRDFPEPYRVGLTALLHPRSFSPHETGEKERVVHYEDPGVVTVTACGMETAAQQTHPWEDQWDEDGWEDLPVCVACLDVARGWLRMWHPRGDLPAWAADTPGGAK